MSNIITGRRGEEIACGYLKKMGYEILERNKRFSRYSEIDIIALDRKTLVFVEVKTRTTALAGSPLEAITKTKYQHIKNGLFMYLKENPQYKKYRIDAVSIILNPEIEIKHLKNIYL